MSHSKMTKRGKSRYIEYNNPYAKKFINTCSVCGMQGYNPIIDSDDFVCENYYTSIERKAIKTELKLVFSPLLLDEFGKCDVCARIIENSYK